MMMAPLLSPHWIPFLNRDPALPATWKSDWVKIVDPDKGLVKALQDGWRVRVLGRRSDLKFAGYEGNPEETARSHFGLLRADPGMAACDVIETPNEPGDLLNPQTQEWLSRYWIAFCNAASDSNVRVCWGQFSTGAPPGYDDEGPAWWKPYESVFANVGWGHYLGLHEYWRTAGPEASSPWHALRYRMCPYETDILITECGLNCAVTIPQDGDHGWRGLIEDVFYVDQLREYAEKCAVDGRVKALFVFTLDFASENWASFDTSGLEDKIRTVNDYLRRGRAGRPDTVPVPTTGVNDLTSILEDYNNLMVLLEGACNDGYNIRGRLEDLKRRL